MLPEARAYLEAHNVMTLATHGADGVWAAAVFYVNDGPTLYFLSAPSTRHGQNVEANPRVALTVQEDYRDWRSIRGIQAEGTCRRLDGAHRDAAIERYQSKFPVVGSDAPPEIARALDKIAWYAVEPVRMYFIDNSVSFGHREEIEL